MGKETFERIMGIHAAPTLAGFKPGSLISFKKKNFENFENLLLAYKKCFACKGISIYILSENFEYAHIFFYREELLKKALENETAKKILLSRGYSLFSLSFVLAKLKQNFCEKDDFPHEIGLFLGYPPEDVKGFIEQKGQNFLVSGYWKVYSNEAETKKLFEKYACCTREFCDKLSAGVSFAELLTAC